VEEPAAGQHDGQRRKLRQAAFVYLHLGALYEGAVYAMARRGILVARGPAERFAPAWLWLVIGAAIVALVFWLLWARESVWTARIVWFLGLFRIPALIEGAFFPGPGTMVPTGFYLVALVAVLLNLGALARAGWDL
jgi:hypothetical protein